MEDIIILWEEKQPKKKIASNIQPEPGQNPNIMEVLNNIVAWFQKIKTKDKVIFYRLMSTMLNAWMSLMKGVWVLEKQEKNPVFKKILQKVLVWLEEWKTFSECLSEHPASFSEAEIWVIKSWEKTWRMNQVMTSLADQVEKVASVSWKLKSALIYPGMIMCVVVWVVLIMMTVVVPKLLEIFEDKSALPSSTKALIFLSDAIASYWYLILLLLAFVYFAIVYWKKTPSWKYNYDKWILGVPVFWNIIQKVVLSKFARVFAWLMASGVSVVESLKIASDAVWNEAYRQRILLLLEDVRQWMKIWESLEGDPLFPDIMIQMIQVWEQTAKLDTTVIKIADFYDEQVDNMAATINKLLEPFIIVFLAVVVGFIAIAIMQPIMNLADTVSNS